MKKIIILLSIGVFFTACGGGNSANEPENTTSMVDTSKTANGNPSYDPDRGEGKFTHVDVSPTLNTSMADKGEKIYKVKCSSCHKLTDEKLVGPGWKGVTSKQTAVWIMNFITNTDVMISKDPKVQALLEICLVRMPNQNLSDDDARNVYEFMRKNDAVK